MFRFSAKVRSIVRHLTEALRMANSNSNTDGVVYAQIRGAIFDIVRQEVEPEVFAFLGDVNWGGNASWLDDLETAIGETKEFVEGPAEEVPEFICG